MDFALLAQSITGVLAPALPFLIMGGKKAAETAGDKIGSDAWEKAKEIWSKLAPKMSEDAEEAARAVACSPQDLNAKQALHQQIEKTLKENPSLVKEVGPLIRASQKIEELQGDATVIDIGELSNADINADQKIKHVAPDGKAVTVSVEKATGGKIKSSQDIEKVEGSATTIKIDKV